jgi:hypothetical protein
MAKAGSLELLGKYGDGGLPTDTFVSAVRAPAHAGATKNATTEANGISDLLRRVIVDSFFRLPAAGTVLLAQLGNERPPVGGC